LKGRGQRWSRYGREAYPPTTWPWARWALVGRAQWRYIREVTTTVPIEVNSPGQRGTATVAIGVDDMVLYPALVLLFSLNRSTRTPLSVRVGFFRGELSSESRSALTAVAGALGLALSLHEFRPDPRLFVGKRHISPTTFLKFLFAEEISGEFVWLDVDTIVFPGWDEFFPRLVSPSSGTQLLVARKASSEAVGFNAGVLGWPRGTPRREWRTEVAASAENGFSLEQDIFNNLYRDNLEWLPVQFNFVALWDGLGSLSSEEIRVLHFAGPLKPWFLKSHLARSCVEADCLWARWYLVEEDMLTSQDLQGCLAVMNDAREEALNCYGDFVSGLPFFRLIRASNTRFGFGATKVLFALANTVRRTELSNTHPFHPIRRPTAPASVDL
jgi:lipopolysaccharide biosynthesis glycosyltransferase